MSRLALAEDAALAFDPTMLGGEIGNDSFFGTSDDADAVDSLIQNAESEFWQRVDSAFRQDEVRRYEVHEIPRSGHRAYRLNFSAVGTRYTQGPEEVRLNHGRVFPFDSTTSPDAVEVRTGQNDWQDITANDSDDWDLVDPSNGIVLIEVDNVFRTHGLEFRTSMDKVWVRFKYRYGSRGGNIRVGGQTTLTDSITTNNTPDFTVGVTDASRLPPAPAIMLLIDESDPTGTSEYVRVTNVDTTNDEITIGGRNQRLTTDTAFSSGDVVHYAPLFVRNAVAKKTAIELTQADDYSEWLPDTDIPLPAPRKIDEWRNDWQDAIDLLS